MNWKKRLPLIMGLVALISLVGAVLLFAVALPRTDAGYKRVFEIILAVLMLLLFALIALYLWMSRDTEPNYFLFDREKKKNVPVEKLTFKTVNERMNFFLTLICDSDVSRVWSENMLEREDKLGARRAYRPLLAYKMLYDLADKNSQTYWDYLLNAKPEVIGSLCNALEQGGEKKMVVIFRELMTRYAADPEKNAEKIKVFVCGNMRYIRGRMVSFITKNIELFY